MVEQHAARRPRRSGRGDVDDPAVHLRRLPARRVGHRRAPRAVRERGARLDPGGLAIVTIGTCALFTVFTGASGVTIIALGGVLMPALVRAGYAERFSIGLIAGTGSVGLLFPPALPLFIYGTVAASTSQPVGIAERPGMTRPVPVRRHRARPRADRHAVGGRGHVAIVRRSCRARSSTSSELGRSFLLALPEL